jgi:hypothetical protein
MQLCLRPCRGNYANLARLSMGLKGRLRVFSPTAGLLLQEPLQGCEHCAPVHFGMIACLLSRIIVLS